MLYPTPSPPRPRRRAGFSLIELLIVLAVLGAIGGIVLPAILTNVDKQRLRRFGEEMSISARAARVQAIRVNGPTVLSVDPDSRTIMSFVDDNDNGVWDQLTEDLLMRRVFPAGVNLEAPPTQDDIDGLEKVGNEGLARFNADGSIDRVGAFRFADRRGNFMEVRIEPQAVARVAVLKWDGTEWTVRQDPDNPWVWK